MYQLTGSAPKSAPAEVPAEFEWQRLWRGIVRRRLLFLGIFAVVFGAIAGYTFLKKPVYTTHVKLIAGNNAGSRDNAAQGQTTLPLLNALLAANGLQTSETYAELFQETPVAQTVINNEHLSMSPGAFLSHVKVRPVVNTSLLDLSVTWQDPQTAARLANAFAAAFVERERSLIAGQADAAIAQLSKQLPDAQRSATRNQAALTRFQASNNLADIQTQTQSTIQAAAGIDSKINTTQLDRRQAAAQLSSVTAQLAKTPATIGGGGSTAPNPVLGQLQQQLAQVNVQLQTAQQQYTEQHPTVINLRNQRSELQSEIARTPPTIISQANTISNPLYQQLMQQSANLRGQVAADDAQLGTLHSQQAAIRPQISALPAQAARLFELQREAKMSQDVLTALQQKLNEASISKTTALSDVTITQPASARDAAIHPDRKTNLVIGFVLSLAIALVVTLLFQAFDRRLRDERQIEEDLELPVLSSVPKLAALRNRLPHQSPVLHLPGANGKGNALPAHGKDEGWLRAFAVESFLQLVTSLRYSATPDRKLRRITFTSPGQGDGKSTIALNTAITMAHIEPRVLLIDGDLRRPSLHSKLNRELGRGLSDVLVGTARLDDVITVTEHDGLDLLTSGTRSPNSVKLIQSQRFDELLEELSRRYSTIIIDAPALAPVVDAAILAAKSDGTVLVVAMDSTDGTAVKRAVQKLQSVGVTNILGTVANRIRPNRRSVYDDYFYVEPDHSNDEGVALNK